MIWFAVYGAIVCAFAAGYCLGYLIYRSQKQRRNAKGQFCK